MALETGTYISDLEPLNPASTDLLKQADDHIRLIKAVLQNTFPNITGAVTATQDDINDPPSSVPVGSILMWYGASTAVPAGFALCDGTLANKSDGSGTIQTPDLRGRIPMGVDGTTLADLGDTAGALTDTADTTSDGDHTHVMHPHDHTFSGTTDSATTGVSISTTQQPVEASNPSQDALDTATITDPGHSHTFSGTTDATISAMDAAGAHTHSVTVDTLPPVLGVHFIMKI